MAFADMLRSDLDGILSAQQFAESVEYRSLGASGFAAPIEINALIERDSPENAIAIGNSAPGQQKVIIATVSKTDIPQAKKGDVIDIGDDSFRVSMILQEDSAGWRLYAHA